MNLQQLRYIHEVARRGLNVSDAAAALHTSQPGVSKQIRAFEEELGVSVFVRSGRRLTAVTDAGQEVLRHVERILAELANLKSIGDEFAHHARGTRSSPTIRRSRAAPRSIARSPRAISRRRSCSPRSTRT